MNEALTPLDELHAKLNEAARALNEAALIAERHFGKNNLVAEQILAQYDIVAEMRKNTHAAANAAAVRDIAASAR